jgi:hypothetical protein
MKFLAPNCISPNRNGALDTSDGLEQNQGKKLQRTGPVKILRTDGDQDTFHHLAGHGTFDKFYNDNRQNTEPGLKRKPSQKIINVD